jgi:hypothetical protein
MVVAVVIGMAARATTAIISLDVILSSTSWMQWFVEILFGYRELSGAFSHLFIPFVFAITRACLYPPVDFVSGLQGSELSPTSSLRCVVDGVLCIG